MEVLEEGSVGRRPSPSVPAVEPASPSTLPPCTEWMVWRSDSVEPRGGFATARWRIVAKPGLVAAYAR